MNQADMEKEKIDKIINYWNTELLSSLESSTSHSDPNLACLDNTIENKILQETLNYWDKNKNGICLDVGSGYGRFVSIFQQFYSEIILLEGAEKIYSKLLKLWENHDYIKCKLGTFESFENNTIKFDLIFVSGLLYLYNEEMTYNFLKKSNTILKEKGLLILRDFIANPPTVKKSNYIQDGFCYYRSTQLWYNYAESMGFEILEIRRSKPQLKFLRASKTLKVLSWLQLIGNLKRKKVANLLMKFGNWQLSDHHIHTVYLVMRAL